MKHLQDTMSYWYLLSGFRLTQSTGTVNQNTPHIRPKWHSLCSLPFQGPKKILDFQGPTLPMPLVMDVASLKTITYRAI